MNTESALICGRTGAEPPCQTDDFSNTILYRRGLLWRHCGGLRANIWYDTTLGWRGSGLINRNLSPQPAYTAFKVSRSELGEATFSGEITAADTGGASGIKGYKFQSGNHRVWVLWSLDGAEHLITFSSVPAAGWDAMGICSGDFNRYKLFGIKNILSGMGAPWYKFILLTGPGSTMALERQPVCLARDRTAATITIAKKHK